MNVFSQMYVKRCTKITRTTYHQYTKIRTYTCVCVCARVSCVLVCLQSLQKIIFNLICSRISCLKAKCLRMPPFMSDQTRESNLVSNSSTTANDLCVFHNRRYAPHDREDKSTTAELKACHSQRKS